MNQFKVMPVVCDPASSMVTPLKEQLKAITIATWAHLSMSVGLRVLRGHVDFSYDPWPAMNQFKKVAIRVISGCLSEEEVMGLNEMLKGMDSDNSGTKTLEELKKGLRKQGTKLSEYKVQQLMEMGLEAAILGKKRNSSLVLLHGTENVSGLK